MFSPSYIIIQGKTANGRKFRPSDWAERIAGLMATMDRRHRMVYSPLLMPFTYDGVSSVVMALELEQLCPDICRQVMNFASSNQLTIIRPQEEPLPHANVA